MALFSGQFQLLLLHIITVLEVYFLVFHVENPPPLMKFCLLVFAADFQMNRKRVMFLLDNNFPENHYSISGTSEDY